MICPCGVDHWLHVAFGLKGIAGMFVALENSKVPPTGEGIEKLEEMLNHLRELLERQKRLAGNP